MKKLIVFLICISMALSGCTENKSEGKTEKNIQTTDYESNGASETIMEDSSREENPQPPENNETNRMAMLDGKLYVDTGEKGIPPTCGVMDFTFNKTTNGMPKKNGQTNFGKGYQGQYYVRKNRIIIMIEGETCVFAYQENDIKNLTMSVVNATSRKAKICLKNGCKIDWEYGEKYWLEYLEENSGVWKPVNTIVEKYAFKDLAHTIMPNAESNITVEWKWLYGKLKKGQYRIIKEIKSSPLLSSVKPNQRTHTISAEFTISK